MTGLERIIAAARRLKVFPLPSVVLFPGAALPLHIFEQRYRDMVKDAVDTDGVFAMAQCDPAQAHAVRPELKAMLCAGTIVLHEAQPDGRYHLVLAGVVRARIKRELEQTKLYREVEAEVVEDPPFSQPVEAQVRLALQELTARLPKEIGSKMLQVATRAKGGALADVVASTVVTEVPRRQELLEELDVGRRFSAVLEELSNVISKLPKSPGPTSGYLN